MKLLPVCFILLSILALNACTVSFNNKNEDLDLDLEPIRLRFEAEKVTTFIKEEKSSIGEGKHLTVRILEPAALEREGFNRDRAVSFAALTTYKSCSEELRADLIAIRIEPKSDVGVQMIESRIYSMDKLQNQAKCKEMADQFIQGRLKGDSLLIFSSFDSQFIADSIISFNLLRLSEQWGAIQSSEYEGAGGDTDLANGGQAKAFYFLDTYEKGVLRTRLVISRGPNFQIVGFSTGEAAKR